MAIRNILVEGDPILDGKSRKVLNFDKKLSELIDDMIETMKRANGIGLAAPQVGILRQVIVIDNGKHGTIELVNPIILKTQGQQKESEGCLSCPEIYGITVRPMKVTVKAQNRHGEYKTYIGTGLLARAFCHEIDHLNGILFKEHVIQYLDNETK